MLSFPDRGVALLETLRDRRGRVLAAAVLLLLATLVQRPLFQIEGADSVLLVRPWDLAWVLVAVLGAISLGAAWAARRRGAGGRLGRLARLQPAVPVMLAVGFGAVCVLSLSWELLTFGTDGFAAAAVRAFRLAAVGYLTLILFALWDDRVARTLSLTVILVATAASLLALYAWWFESSGDGFGVTRPGGPFGNYFADGSADRWWAWPAASTTLGLWIGVALVLIVGGAVGALSSARRPSVSISIAAGATIAVLVAGLVATHSRESWVAATGALLVMIVILRGQIPRRVGLFVVAPALVAGVVLLASLPSVRARLTDTFETGSFAYETGPEARLDAWQRGLEVGFDRLPVGWGVGGVEEHADRFGLLTSENLFIQTFMQTGLLGLALLVGVVVVSLRRSYVALRRDGPTPSGLLAAAVFLVLMLHGVFGNSIGDPSVQALVACGIAAAAAVSPSVPSISHSGARTAGAWRRVRRSARDALPAGRD